ncbi:hypothetical protein [Streptomyces sp. NPDC048438]|uniref:hypothetical protein n=1 Tax=Streptomyces sp. NPDC048438 TaxID=3365551 RepID=UPI003722B4E1
MPAHLTERITVSRSTARPGVFAALRVRDYRIYWSTGLVSNTGTTMQRAALDRFVLNLRTSGPPWAGRPVCSSFRSAELRSVVR